MMTAHAITARQTTDDARRQALASVVRLLIAAGRKRRERVKHEQEVQDDD